MFNPATSANRHLVIVDAYTGFLEYLTDEQSEIDASAGLGLPIDEIAAHCGARITLLDWSDWYRSEALDNSFARWIPYPATKPVAHPNLTGIRPFAPSGVRRLPVPAADPEGDRPFAAGYTPRSYGLLAESDPLFLASYILNACIESLHEQDPIDAILLPVFGGLGYVAQMSRATGAGLTDIPMGVIVTGASVDRQTANGEGHWTRPAMTRRQMEDMSLGLADLVLCFGPLGEARARAGGCEEPVRVPRRVEPRVLEEIAEARAAPTQDGPIQFFIHEPMQGASGALVTLDAAQLLHMRGDRISRPISISGQNMRFPLNLPRDFKGYWSGRGWAKELVEKQLWSWDDAPPASPDTRKLRLFPSLFEHLPEIWSEIAKGHSVLLSPEAAEGLAPGEALPPELIMEQAPTADALADHMARLEAMPPAELERYRLGLCDAVLRAHDEKNRARIIDHAIGRLQNLIDGTLPRPRLDHVAQRLLDRRIDVGGREAVPTAPAMYARPDNPTLAVAVACYEMGDLLVETIESIWASTRIPDEVLLIDDGSRGAETQAAIERLENKARACGLPFTVVRQSNRGLAAARNRALAETRSTYISFLDGDDLIGADFYRLALDILQTNPALGGVAAWAETFGEGVPPGFWNAPQPELPLLLAENTVFVPFMMPVGLLRDLGGYDTRQRYNYEDWELPIRFLAAGWPIITIPRYLQRYRVRSDSLLRTMSDVQNQVMREELFRNHRTLIEKFGPELSAQIEHRLMRTLARHSEEGAGNSTQAALDLLRNRATQRIAQSIDAFGWRARSYVERWRRR